MSQAARRYVRHNSVVLDTSGQWELYHANNNQVKLRRLRESGLNVYWSK